MALSTGLRVRAALVVLLLASLLATGCATRTPRTLELTGSVASTVVTVQAPGVPQPVADLEAGFASAPAKEGTPTVEIPAPTSGSRPSSMQTWMRVARVDVKPGDYVTSGQVIAVVDDALLAADVAQAEAAAVLSRANLDAAGLRSRETSEGMAEIDAKRSEIATQTAELQLQRQDLQMQLDQARILAGTPVATGQPDPADKVAELEKAIAEIDDALVKLGEALADLNKAAVQLGDARTALESLSRAMTALVDAREVAVRIAQFRQSQATVKSPVAGVVVSAVAPGAVVAPGAPLVEIRPAGANVIHTYITAEQRELITRGASARVRADSIRGTVLAGAVVDIGSEYEYVPTSFATKIIHLVRGLKVTIIVYGNRVPPAGTPVDVSIDTLASTSP